MEEMKKGEGEGGGGWRGRKAEGEQYDIMLNVLLTTL